MITTYIVRRTIYCMPYVIQYILYDVHYALKEVITPSSWYVHARRTVYDVHFALNEYNLYRLVYLQDTYMYAHMFV